MYHINVNVMSKIVPSNTKWMNRYGIKDIIN